MSSLALSPMCCCECRPCELFAELYIQNGSPPIEIELAGVTGLFCTFNGTYIYPTIALAPCSNTVSPFWIHQGTYIDSLFGNQRRLLLKVGGDGTGNDAAILSVYGDIFISFGGVPIIEYTMTSCTSAMQAIRDLFDGKDVRVPYFTGSCVASTPAIIRLQ